MYQIDQQGQIVRIDGMVIPRDITNPAYTQYLYWQQHGNYIGPQMFIPAEEPAVAPVIDIPARKASDIASK
jgi:hypothetical protein